MSVDHAVSARAASGESVTAPKGDIDQIAINTIRTLADRRGARRPIPATPARRWASRRWPTRSGPGSCATTRRSRCGRTATASCSPTGTPRMLLYALLHLAGVAAVDAAGKPTRPAGGQPGRHQELPPARQRLPRATRSTATPPASRPPPARSARASATSVGMAMAERWLAARFNQPGHDALRLQRLRHLQRRRPDGGHLRRGRLARRPPEALQPLLDLRRQPHHHRRPHRARLHRGRGRSASRATAGRPSTVDDANDCEAFARADRGVPGHRRPADADPGAGASSATARRTRQGTSKIHSDPLGEDEVKADQARLRLAGGRAVPGSGRRARALRRDARRPRRASCARPGTRPAPRYAEAFPDLAAELEQIAAGALPDGLGRGPPELPGRRQGHRHAARPPARR